MSLLFGVDWKIGALIMLALLLGLYFSKDTYSKIEKGVMVCILGMILAFLCHPLCVRRPGPPGIHLGTDPLGISGRERPGVIGFSQYPCFHYRRDLRNLSGG